MIHLLGAIGGVGFTLSWIWLAKRYNIEGWSYAGGMLLLPLFYVGFALLAPDNQGHLIEQELLHGLPFFIGGAVLLLWRAPASLYAVAAFWLAHAFYDFGHDLFFINPGVWEIYPAFCAGVDGALGVYLLYLASTKKAGATAPA